MPKILGVDPGIEGALALLDTDACTLALRPMPVATHKASKGKEKTSVDTQRLAFDLRALSPDIAYIEHVHSSPQMGVVSAFSFGYSYGTVRGTLDALHVTTTPVSPVIWKRALRVPADKALARSRASELFPACAQAWRRAKDDGLAEAALIALYGALNGLFTPPPTARITLDAYPSKSKA